MIFSSTIFLLYFLPIFLLIYHLVPQKHRNTVILAASILFYSWGAPKFIFVIIGCSIINFYLVKYLHHSTNEKIRKLLLTSSIFINLALLFFFKYINFVVDNLNLIIEGIGHQQIEWVAIALPIGISFYTFQILTYSIDVYRGIQAPLKKVSDYLLYIMSFPQMIAGPIVRFSSVATEIEHRTEKVDDKLSGFYRFCIGLGKKVLIANVMGQQASIIMDGNLADIGIWHAWIGLLAYTFQIYFDFSGYSDMAIGLGKIMGFTFPENFDSPYTSRSITEFWRRWHITLGTWMRDYLYIPLGGNRVKSKTRLYSNLWVVFLLSGLWHGASWNFILWGAFHGFFLILDRIFLLSVLNKLGTMTSTFITFIIVMIGWLVFRLEDFSSFSTYFIKLVDFNSISSFPELIPSFSLKLFIAIILSFTGTYWIGKNIQTYLLYRGDHSLKTHYLLLSGALLIFLFSLSSISSQGFNPFIYFRF